MPKLVVFKSDLLPYSETFIAQQVSRCQRWIPTLVGMRKVPGGLPLKGLDAVFLEDVSWVAKHPNRIKVVRELGVVLPTWKARLDGLAPQLIHVHFATELVMHWPLFKAMGVPIVVTLHGADITTAASWWTRKEAGWASRRYPRRLREIAASPMVHFIAVSEAIKEAAIGFGIPAEKIEVAYIGVDTGYFQPGETPVHERKPLVLFVGRMVEKKGVKYLLEAFARVHQTLHEAQLVLVGEGPLLDEAKALARSLGVNAQFPGKQSSAQIRDWMSEARVFCLPSVTAANGDAEGLGIVLLEAQACGVPCVTSANGGAKEAIVDGETGHAFAEKDVDALTAHLLDILVSDARAAQMSQAAVCFVARHHALDECTRRLELIYDRLAATPV